ncbi:TPA: helix-turn-helix domain-containing protein [Vibrio parahaemolyticus]|nr:helix-turn-helix domain-containing protein [Vibrio parahaemolyticus]
MSYNKEDRERKNDICDPNYDEELGSINERLKYLSNKRTTRETAKLWGVSVASLNAYINRGSLPSVDKALRIANAEGVSLQWLATGNDERPDYGNKTNDINNLVRIDYVEKFSVAASAGGGSYIEEERVEEYYPFSHEYLKRNRLLHADLLIIEARGDSMEPYIENGDDLLIKRVEFNTDNALSGIHVISIDGQLKVKRLQYSIQRNGYRIISDNPEYSEEFIEHEELMQNRMRVIGEVVVVMGRPSQAARV